MAPEIDESVHFLGVGDAVPAMRKMNSVKKGDRRGPLDRFVPYSYTSEEVLGVSDQRSVEFRGEPKGDSVHR